MADATGAAVNHERQLPLLDPQVARQLRLVGVHLLDELLGVLGVARRRLGGESRLTPLVKRAKTRWIKANRRVTRGN